MASRSTGAAGSMLADKTWAPLSAAPRAIATITASTKTILLSAVELDKTAEFPAGGTITLSGTTGGADDGDYVIASSSYIAGITQTQIITVGAIPGDDNTGTAEGYADPIAGDACTINHACTLANGETFPASGSVASLDCKGSGGSLAVTCTTTVTINATTLLGWEALDDSAVTGAGVLTINGDVSTTANTGKTVSGKTTISGDVTAGGAALGTTALQLSAGIDLDAASIQATNAGDYCAVFYGDVTGDITCTGPNLVMSAGSSVNIIGDVTVTASAVDGIGLWLNGSPLATILGKIICTAPYPVRINPAIDFEAHGDGSIVRTLLSADLPPAGYVLAASLGGTAYGFDGELTPTLTYPAASNTLSTAGTYGVAGTGVTPTLGATNVLATVGGSLAGSNVLAGAGGSLAGSNVLATVGGSMTLLVASNALNGINRGDGVTGTYQVANLSSGTNVKNGITFGPAGSLTGSLTEAAMDSVTLTHGNFYTG